MKSRANIIRRLANPFTTTTSKAIFMKSNPNQSDVPLCDAPENFMDVEKWQSVLAQSESRDLALRELRVRPAFLTFYMDDTDPHNVSEETRVEGELLIAREALVLAFKAQLLSGDILASGINVATGERRDIPPELWSDLEIHFADNVAVTASLKFSHVRLNAVPAKDTLISQVAEYMRTYADEHGRSERKVLKGIMEKAFPNIKAREFDEAYRMAFGKSVGRPKQRS
jgi:hypothetical protein